MLPLLLLFGGLLAARYLTSNDEARQLPPGATPRNTAAEEYIERARLASGKLQVRSGVNAQGCSYPGPAETHPERSRVLRQQLTDLIREVDRTATVSSANAMDLVRIENEVARLQAVGRRECA